jgi:hypothetical protein
MRTLVATVMIVCFVTLPFVGCESQTVSQTAKQNGPSAEGVKYLLTDEPTDAQPVISVRENAEHDDEVVIVGRIGGGANPWIEGLAAFSIVDQSLKACSDIPGDACKTPWDYCCEPELSTGMALVKVVGSDGKPVRVDARELLAVKELSTVVVTGRAERDDSGNLTVLATGIFVQE